MNEHGSSFDQGYEPSASIMELEKLEQNLERASKDVSFLTSSAIKVRNIVAIQCTNNAGEKQQQYSSCWGIVQCLYGQSIFIRFCGEIVEYLFCGLNLLENPTPTIMEVSDHAASLWQAPDLQRMCGIYSQRFTSED
jgi:hypothetical protein